MHPKYETAVFHIIFACILLAVVNSRYLLTLGILHGVHWGLGHGSGELIGGLLISTFGASTTFAIFGAFCLVLMAVYILVTNLTNNSDQNGGKT